MFSGNELIMLMLFLVAGLSSFVLTGFLRRYALKKNLMDIPNVRSSHLDPTPRGGGMAIVLVFMTGLTVMSVINGIPSALLMALTGAGSLVALVGFVDDHNSIPARWRLLAHFSGAVWALVWLGGLPSLPLFGYMLDMSWLGHGIAAIYLVWV